jgi:hypothetical protein
MLHAVENCCPMLQGRWTAATVIAIVIGVSVAGAQSVPDYSGRWMLDEARSGRPIDVCGQSRVVDDTLGTLPNFVRKVRTQARWDGRTLTLETEHFSESIDRRTGEAVVRRGITSVLRLELEANGRELVVERTGFRAEPPSVLHGRPYDRKDDLAYNVDRIRYSKIG